MSLATIFYGNMLFFLVSGGFKDRVVPPEIVKDARRGKVLYKLKFDALWGHMWTDVSGCWWQVAGTPWAKFVRGTFACHSFLHLGRMIVRWCNPCGNGILIDASFPITSHSGNFSLMKDIVHDTLSHGQWFYICLFSHKPLVNFQLFKLNLNHPPGCRKCYCMIRKGNTFVTVNTQIITMNLLLIMWWENCEGKRL